MGQVILVGQEQEDTPAPKVETWRDRLQASPPVMVEVIPQQVERARPILEEISKAGYRLITFQIILMQESNVDPTPVMALYCIWERIT